jgi:hypothetical protein
MSPTTPGSRTVIAGLMLLGAAIRLAHLPFIDLARPFNKGGLYAEFAHQIAAHGYWLPRVIPFYTDGGIPFAYPPLPFYLEAVLVYSLRLPEFPIVNLLPALFSVLTLPPFYALVRELRLDDRTALAALLVYATLPTAYSQHVGGAGLAEAFGTFALLWFVFSLARAHHRDSPLSYALAGLFWALCVTASPGTAYASIPTFGLFALVQLARGQLRPRVRRLALLTLSGVVAVAASSPYWLSVMLNHGPHVFLDTLATQQGGELADSLGRVLSLRVFQFPGGPAPFLWSIALFSGVVWAAIKRQWALLAWFVALSLVPRERSWTSAVPASILAGVGCTRVLLPLLVRLVRGRPRWTQRPAAAGALVLVLGLTITLLAFALPGRTLAAARRAGLQPSREALQAMEWVRTNTPAESKFVVLHDTYVKEWVPRIARRTVLNMAFGSEWEPEEAVKIKELSSCRDFDCIHSEVARTMGYPDVYLYLERSRISSLRARPAGGLAPSTSFELIWQNSEVAVGLLRTRLELLGRNQAVEAIIG